MTTLPWVHGKIVSFGCILQNLTRSSTVGHQGTFRLWLYEYRVLIWLIAFHILGKFCFSQKSPYNKPKAPNVYITAGTYNQWRNCPTSCMSKHFPSFFLCLYVMGLREHVATQTAILPTCSSAARFLMQSPALLNWTTRMRCSFPGLRSAVCRDISVFC